MFSSAEAVLVPEESVRIDDLGRSHGSAIFFRSFSNTPDSDFIPIARLTLLGIDPRLPRKLLESDLNQHFYNFGFLAWELETYFFLCRNVLPFDGMCCTTLLPPLYTLSLVR